MKVCAVKSHGLILLTIVFKPTTLQDLRNPGRPPKVMKNALSHALPLKDCSNLSKKRFGEALMLRLTPELRQFLKIRAIGRRQAIDNHVLLCDLAARDQT
jgi:hypothetical protein